MNTGTRIMLSNYFNNKALAASQIPLGALGIIETWHANLDCGMCKFYANGRTYTMPIIVDNVLKIY